MDEEPSGLERQIASIASLNEPVRRALYDYVASQPEDVSRDQAASALGITRPLAVFHLDKLVEEGLLDVRYERLTGRTGPGAGRPSKLYRRSYRQLGLTLPPRQYELAARLLARAVSESSSDPARTTLARVARDVGARLGDEARPLTSNATDDEGLMEAIAAVLRSYGYEPFHDAGGAIRLRNCPFHALARDYRQLVCGMNHSLLSGLTDGLHDSRVEAVLDPQPGLCCVAFCRKAANT